jgi:hypothetical protein
MHKRERGWQVRRFGERMRQREREEREGERESK